MTKRILVIFVCFLVVTIAGTAGYFIGFEKASYRQDRGAITMAYASNAKLEAKLYDRLQYLNDFTIHAHYFGIQNHPKWLLPIFTFGEERSDDSDVQMKADLIQVSLSRMGANEPREKIEQVARDWLAFHKTISVTIERDGGIERGSAVQPATAPQSESKDNENTKTGLEVRPQ